MADDTPEKTEKPATAPQIQFNVLSQYIRDMSFENLLAQKGLSGDLAPKLGVQVNLDARKGAGEDQYQIAVKITVSSNNEPDQQPLFLLELDYAGMFHVAGIPEQQLHPFLMIECPRMLFPFIRRIVSDVTRDGGFPPVNLDTIDFAALYRNELLRRQAAQSDAEGAGKPADQPLS